MYRGKTVFIIFTRSGFTGYPEHMFIFICWNHYSLIEMAKKTLTTNQGVPVAVNQNFLTPGHGPGALQDVHLIENQEMTL